VCCEVSCDVESVVCCGECGVLCIVEGVMCCGECGVLWRVWCVT